MEFVTDQESLLWLKGHINSPVVGEAMFEAGTKVRDLYRSIVAKRSGALAASAQVFTYLNGGVHFDRAVAEITVGGDTPRGGYGASHEFGIGIHPRSRVPPTHWMPQAPVNDLIKVLAVMDFMS